ncbi:MAG: SprB repeat-containing protein [Lachnospiraceae bacterium]|nr:SprB repeat-containing protein [Lachnospiraceae bacterium]
MKRSSQPILMFSAFLVLLLVLLPTALKPEEAHAEPRAPYMTIEANGDDVLYVRLIAGDNYQLKNFGGSLDYSNFTSFLKLMAVGSGISGFKAENGDEYSPGDFYADFVSASGQAVSVSKGTVLAFWGFQATGSTKKLVCGKTYSFRFETEWAEGPNGDLDYWGGGDSFNNTWTAKHHFDGGVNKKAATCTSPGVKTYTCLRCGATQTENVPATGHKPVRIPAKAATCTAPGLTEGQKCGVCGTILQAQQSTPALGHDWDEGITSIEVGEFSYGIVMYTCKRCRTTRDEEIKVTPEMLFDGLRDLTPEAANAKPLTIVRQPEGGQVPYETRGEFQMSVAVSGGTAPYTYEWYSSDPNAKEEMLSPASDVRTSLLDAANRLRQYASRAGSKVREALRKKFLSSRTNKDTQTKDGRKSPLDKLLKSSEDNSIYLCTGGLQYYCIIKDASGNSVASDSVSLDWQVHFAEQPEDQYPYKDYVFTARAEGGKAPYSYAWYYYDGNVHYSDWTAISGANGPELPADTEGLIVDAPIVCAVMDRDGIMAFSQVVKVLDDGAFTIQKKDASPAAIESGETSILSVWIRGGELPLTVTFRGVNGDKYVTSSGVEEVIDGSRCLRFEVAVDRPDVYYILVADKNYEHLWDGIEVERIVGGDRAVGDDLMLTGVPDVANMWDAASGLADVMVDFYGGQGPYTIEWFRSPGYESEKPTTDRYEPIRNDKIYDDGWYEGNKWCENLDRNGYSSPYCALVPGRPDEYLAFRITDANGESIWAEGIPIVYRSTVPFFTTQPENLRIPYDAFGKVNYGLYCHAVEEWGGEYDLEYQWLKYRAGSWKAVPDATETFLPISQNDQCGVYRCRVTNPRSAESVLSVTVSVSCTLECVEAYVYKLSGGTAYSTFSFKGGTPPYNVTVTQKTQYKGQQQYTGEEWYYDKDQELYSLTCHNMEDIQNLHFTFNQYRRLKVLYVGKDSLFWYENKIDNCIVVTVTDANGQTARKTLYSTDHKDTQ